MKILVFNGSTWGRRGNTNLMCQDFCAGAFEAGAKVQTIHLSEKKIEVCLGCEACFFQTPGRCKIKDDMPALIDKFTSSDVAIFTTPVYMDNVTGLTKMFIDRLLPILDPHYEKDKFGECRRCPRYDRYPKLFVIASCAMPEASHFEVLRVYFRRLARTFHTELIGEIYLPAAGLMYLGTQEPEYSDLVKQHRDMLGEAGKQLCQSGKVSEDLLDKLNKPMVDVEDYIQYANRIWDKLLSESALEQEQ